MAHFAGLNFVDVYINASGNTFDACTFRECIVFAKSGAHYSFDNCVLRNCDYLGDGWCEGLQQIRTRHTGRRHDEPEVQVANRKRGPLRHA